MKICYIVGHYIPHIGGVEILFENYAKGMKAAGHEVRVITSSSGGVHGHVNRDGIDVWYYDWKIMFGHPVAKSSDMEEHIKWADIVHTTTFTVANPARRICKKYSKPVIITVHEVLGDKWNWIESNRIKAIGYRLFEKYVCCKPYDYVHVISEATRNDYIRYYGERKNLVMIYNSIDDNLTELPEKSNISFNDVFGTSENQLKFLYFGRPGQSKGIFVLQNAIKLLKEKHGSELSDVVFCFLISNDPARQREIFETNNKEFKLDSLVKVHDSMPRTDLFKIISEADCVVVPSITEGFGFCAAETCALDKNIIYSDGGSLPEVVSGNTIGFKNMDSNDLAEKIYSVITKGEAAFEKVPKKSFSTQKMIEAFIDFYNKVYSDNY